MNYEVIRNDLKESVTLLGQVSKYMQEHGEKGKEKEHGSTGDEKKDDALSLSAAPSPSADPSPDLQLKHVAFEVSLLRAQIASVLKQTQALNMAPLNGGEKASKGNKFEVFPVSYGAYNESTTMAITLDAIRAIIVSSPQHMHYRDLETWVYWIDARARLRQGRALFSCDEPYLTEEAARVERSTALVENVLQQMVEDESMLSVPVKKRYFTLDAICADRFLSSKRGDEEHERLCQLVRAILLFQMLRESVETIVASLQSTQKEIDDAVESASTLLSSLPTTATTSAVSSTATTSAVSSSTATTSAVSSTATIVGNVYKSLLSTEPSLRSIIDLVKKSKSAHLFPKYLSLMDVLIDRVNLRMDQLTELLRRASSQHSTDSRQILIVFEAMQQLLEEKRVKDFDLAAQLIVHGMRHANAIATCVLFEESNDVKEESFVFGHINAGCWCPMCTFVCSSEMLPTTPTTGGGESILKPQILGMFLHTLVFDGDEVYYKYLAPAQSLKTSRTLYATFSFFDFVPTSVIGSFLSTYLANSIEMQGVIERLVRYQGAAHQRNGGGGSAGGGSGDKKRQRLGKEKERGGRQLQLPSVEARAHTADLERFVTLILNEQTVMRLMDIVLEAHRPASPALRALHWYTDEYEERFDDICASYGAMEVLRNRREKMASFAPSAATTAPTTTAATTAVATASADSSSSANACSVSFALSSASSTTVSTVLPSGDNNRDNDVDDDVDDDGDGDSQSSSSFLSAASSSSSSSKSLPELIPDEEFSDLLDFPRFAREAEELLAKEARRMKTEAEQQRLEQVEKRKRDAKRRKEAREEEAAKRRLEEKRKQQERAEQQRKLEEDMRKKQQEEARLKREEEKRRKAEEERLQKERDEAARRQQEELLQKAAEKRERKRLEKQQREEEQRRKRSEENQKRQKEEDERRRERRRVVDLENRKKAEQKTHEQQRRCPENGAPVAAATGASAVAAKENGDRLLLDQQEIARLWDESIRLEHLCDNCARHINVKHYSFYVFQCTAGCSHKCLCARCYRRITTTKTEREQNNDNSIKKNAADSTTVARVSNDIDRCYKNGCNGRLKSVLAVKNTGSSGETTYRLVRSEKLPPGLEPMCFPTEFQPRLTVDALLERLALHFRIVGADKISIESVWNAMIALLRLSKTHMRTSSRYLFARCADTSESLDYRLIALSLLGSLLTLPRRPAELCSFDFSAC